MLHFHILNEFSLKSTAIMLKQTPLFHKWFACPIPLDYFIFNCVIENSSECCFIHFSNINYGKERRSNRINTKGHFFQWNSKKVTNRMCWCTALHESRYIFTYTKHIISHTVFYECGMSHCLRKHKQIVWTYFCRMTHSLPWKGKWN